VILIRFSTRLESLPPGSNVEPLSKWPIFVASEFRQRQVPCGMWIFAGEGHCHSQAGFDSSTHHIMLSSDETPSAHVPRPRFRSVKQMQCRSCKRPAVNLVFLIHDAVPWYKSLYVTHSAMCYQTIRVNPILDVSERSQRIERQGQMGRTKDNGIESSAYG